MKLRYALIGLVLLLPTSLLAQTSRNPCFINSTGGCTPVSSTNPLPVTSGGGGGGTSSNFGAAFPSAGTAAGMSDGTNMVPFLGDANGTKVQGNAASLATDAGNPLKVGGLINTTSPTAGTTGQRIDWWMGGRGSGAFFQTSQTGAVITDVATNTVDGVSTGVGAPVARSFGYLFNASTFDRWRSINGAVAAGTGTAAVAIAPTSAATGGITPTVTGAGANNLVLKASAGNLYSAYATNLTSTAGFLIILNATSAPADGAVTPLDCAPLPAGGNASINFGAGPPSVYSTGITAVVTSAATCFTKTTGVITAFINGRTQ